MEQRFFLNGVDMGTHRFCKDQRIERAVAVLPHRAKPASTRRDSTASGTKFALHQFMCELFIKEGFVEGPVGAQTRKVRTNS